MPIPLNADTLNRVGEHLDIDLFTKQFIFGNDERYRSLRSETILQSEGPSISLLRLILREAMTPEKRREVFADPFDLGSSTDIPRSQCSLMALATKVRSERKAGDDPETRNNEFEHLGKVIKTLTGARLSDYPDKQNTLRVVYLLEQLGRDPNKHSFGRRERIFSLLRLPTLASASFESRTEHPTLHSRGFSATVAELRDYLSIEIATDVADKIDSFYGSIPDWLDAAFSSLLEASQGKSWRSEGVQFLRNASRRISEIDFSPEEKALQERRLDVDLYTHTHRWESLNFLLSLHGVLPFSTKTSRVNNVLPLLNAASVTFVSELDQEIDFATQAIELRDVTSLLCERRDAVMAMVEAAIGFRPSAADFEQAAKESVELLSRTLAFSRGALDTGMIKVSMTEVVAAALAVLDEHRSPTKFLVRAYGKGTISRSLSSTLKKRALGDPDESAEIPEALSQAWSLRYEWMKAGILGFSERNEAKLDLQRVLLEKAADCVSAVELASAIERKEQISNVIDDLLHKK